MVKHKIMVIESNMNHFRIRLGDLVKTKKILKQQKFTCSGSKFNFHQKELDLLNRNFDAVIFTISLTFLKTFILMTT